MPVVEPVAFPRLPHREGFPVQDERPLLGPSFFKDRCLGSDSAKLSSLQVPQTQSIVEVDIFVATETETHSANWCLLRETQQTQFLDMLKVQFSDKVDDVPVVGQRQVPQFRSCSSSTVVDTPVFAQRLIPMAPAIEISQLQFDKVVFVPVVQGVQFHTAGGFMSSTSVSRKGWFPWSCTLKTTEIPPVAVHVVVDVLLKQVPQVRMVQTVQKCISLSPAALDVAGDGRDSAVNCGGSAVGAWLDLLGPCAQAHGQG